MPHLAVVAACRDGRRRTGRVGGARHAHGDHLAVAARLLLQVLHHLWGRGGHGRTGSRWVVQLVCPLMRLVGGLGAARPRYTWAARSPTNASARPVGSGKQGGRAEQGGAGRSVAERGGAGRSGAERGGAGRSRAERGAAGAERSGRSGAGRGGAGPASGRQAGRDGGVGRRIRCGIGAPRTSCCRPRHSPHPHSPPSAPRNPLTSR
jgi:hypothetical protein